MAKPHLEIERRWLLSSLPGPEILKAPSMCYIHYTTIYFFIDPNLETRIQRRVDHGGPILNLQPKITFPVVTKLGRGMIRQESPKLEADEKTYEYYFNLSPPLSRLPMNLWKASLMNGQRWEIKTVDWIYAPPCLGFTHLNNVVLAEMEFRSEESALAFGTKNFPLHDFPVWLKPLKIKEVTDDPRYNMRSLAVHGIPNPR